MTKSLGLLTDAILERDQPRTADLFFRMVKREGQSLGDALDVVTTAEAPFVQVPSHINVRDGQIALINNDHVADMMLPHEFRRIRDSILTVGDDNVAIANFTDRHNVSN